MVDDKNQKAELILVFMFPILAGISLGLRLWGRRISKYPYGWDDYLIIFAYILIVLHMVGSYHHVIYNDIGIHAKDRPFRSDPTLGKRWSLATMALYAPCLPLTKMSMLLFFSRLEHPSKNLLRFIWFTFIFTLLAFLASFTVIFLQCHPVYYTYNPDPNGVATCIDKGLYFTSLTSLAIFTDILVLVIPIIITHSLRLPLGRKIGVTVLLSLGGIVTIISLWRLGLFVRLVYSNSEVDGIHMFGFSASTLETSTAVICACGPGIKPVFKRYFPSFLSSSQNATPRTTYYDTPGFPDSGLEIDSLEQNYDLALSRSEATMFELAESRLSTHPSKFSGQELGGSSSNGTEGGFNGGGSSIFESDSEQAVTKSGSIRTPDNPINYQANDSQHAPRDPSGDGRAISVDSIV